MLRPYPFRIGDALVDARKIRPVDRCWIEAVGIEASNPGVPQAADGLIGMFRTVRRM